jgi:hypothetical protein
MAKHTDCGDDHVERDKHMVNRTDCGENWHHFFSYGPTAPFRVPRPPYFKVS